MPVARWAGKRFARPRRRATQSRPAIVRSKQPIRICSNRPMGYHFHLFEAKAQIRFPDDGSRTPSKVKQSNPELGSPLDNS
jgi:hypothetical protein